MPARNNEGGKGFFRDWKASDDGLDDDREGGVQLLLFMVMTFCILDLKLLNLALFTSFREYTLLLFKNFLKEITLFYMTIKVNYKLKNDDKT